MSQSFDAIYENGVLRPLQPVVLTENQRVTVSVQTSEAGNQESQLAAWCAQYADPSMTRERLKDMLSNIFGSFSDEIIAERER